MPPTNYRYFEIEILLCNKLNLYLPIGSDCIQWLRTTLSLTLFFNQRPFVVYHFIIITIQFVSRHRGDIYFVCTVASSFWNKNTSITIAQGTYYYNYTLPHKLNQVIMTFYIFLQLPYSGELNIHTHFKP